MLVSSVTKRLFYGFILRLLLFVISLILDQYQVKFTDVDYFVFSDAAKYVYEGASPYNRATYRYTPILSYILVGNIWNPYFGKLFFIFCDLIVALFIELQGFDSSLWILNPIIAIISVRGNAESFVSAIILLFLYFLKKNNVVISGLFFGFACHVKIYPIIYAPAALVYLNQRKGTLLDNLKGCLSVNSIKFFISSASVFLGLLSLFYRCYGYEFLYETYLYHVVRKDHRHNFSIYFYPLYLSNGSNMEQMLSLVGFFPQFVLVGLIGLRYGAFIYDVVFLQTILFVALNKVMTSQYLIWYLCFLPFCYKKIIRVRQKWYILLNWVVSQLFWLYNAYLLEFKGNPTFIYLWASSICFSFSHIWFVYNFMDLLNKSKIQ
eukprot:NODE_84_length_22354_cov_0.646506.p7 type:complete len:378 gc:universal NODE_84_length_22354_cov_0.646506:7243-8376(+)